MEPGTTKPTRQELDPTRPVDHEVPKVRLGELIDGGLAPAILAIVERGVSRRPVLARALRAEVALHIDDGYPPVRIVFDEHRVLVEDGAAESPDLRVRGTLPDLIGLMVSPLVGGLPVPINARGRAAVGMMVQRRVRVEGRIALMRRLLAIIRV